MEHESEIEFNITNTININSGGNVINIIYNNKSENDNKAQDAETISPYKITISRKRQFAGCAVIYRFTVNGTMYELTNGGQISFSTDIKHLNIDVEQAETFGYGETVYSHLTGEANGENINMIVTTGNRFDKFSLDIISTTNKTLKFQ